MFTFILLQKVTFTATVPERNFYSTSTSFSPIAAANYFYLLVAPFLLGALSLLQRLGRALG